jgi:hypothetical protein
MSYYDDSVDVYASNTGVVDPQGNVRGRGTVAGTVVGILDKRLIQVSHLK